MYTISTTKKKLYFYDKTFTIAGKKVRNKTH